MLSDLLFISPAFAQAAGEPNPWSGFIPLLFVFVVFYFLLIRPQQKKYKDHQKMIEAVKRGDNVVTAGGVHGKVTKVADDGTVMVKIADELEIKVEKSTLSNVTAKTGANDNSQDKKTETKEAKDATSKKKKA